MSYQWICIRKYLLLLFLLPLAFIAWLGEKVRKWMRLTYEDWMVNRMVKYMIESGQGPRALPGFDAVKIVEEERRDRC